MTKLILKCGHEIADGEIAMLHDDEGYALPVCLGVEVMRVKDLRLAECVTCVCLREIVGVK